MCRHQGFAIGFLPSEIDRTVIGIAARFEHAARITVAPCLRPERAERLEREAAESHPPWSQHVHG